MGTVHKILQAKGNQIFSIRPEETVYRALELLVEKNIGALMVTDEQGRYLGTVTERDYARKIVLKGRSSKDTQVRDIMDTHPFVHENTDIAEVMQKMTARGFRHLPVVDHHSQLTGVISIGDIVKHIIDEQQFIIDNLEDYISGKHH
jgi:CBS domain-containing protein